MSESEIEQQIDKIAQEPAEARGDQGSIKQHSIAELIEADKHKARKQASRLSGLPFRVGKIRPPGTA